MSKRETPQGIVSERFMRHHYGASGYISKTQKPTEEKCDLLQATKKLLQLIRDCHNVFQNHSASWIMQQSSFKNAEAAVQRAEAERKQQ